MEIFDESKEERRRRLNRESVKRYRERNGALLRARNKIRMREYRRNLTSESGEGIVRVDAEKDESLESDFKQKSFRTRNAATRRKRNETEEQAAKRRRSHADRQIQRRRNETEEQAERRRRLHAARQVQRRRSETPERAARRRRLNAERMARNRAIKSGKLPSTTIRSIAKSDHSLLHFIDSNLKREQTMIDDSFCEPCAEVQFDDCCDKDGSRNGNVFVRHSHNNKYKLETKDVNSAKNYFQNENISERFLQNGHIDINNLICDNAQYELHKLGFQYPPLNVKEEIGEKISASHFTNSVNNEMLKQESTSSSIGDQIYLNSYKSEELSNNKFQIFT